MRLYDKILTQAQPELLKTIRPSLERAQVLMIDDIGRQYCESPIMEWSAENYPYARSPFEVAFLEWNTPNRMLIDGEWHENEAAKGGQQGVLCWSKELNIKSRDALREAIKSEPCSGNIDEIMHGVDHGDVCATAAVFQHVQGKMLCPQGAGLWLLSGSGEVLSWMVKGPDHLLQQHAIAMGYDPVHAMQSYYIGFYHVAWLAFTFCNCKNVSLEDATEEAAPLPKIRRRLGIPETKRYTLKIAGHVSKAPRSATTSPQEGVMPFHLCRGHFATYTEDKPLFGRPGAVGRYWHPPHMKGKRERGEVIKDYAIAATSSSEAT